MATSRPPQHVSFVLVAEFDIDKGAVIAQQYPRPTGTDEQLLAESMLPDGVHLLAQDWTIFFLNQSAANAIIPSNEEGADVEAGKLMYVLSLVRTKRDDSARRGAVVKALAICTCLPYFQIFKPVLLIALDEYYKNPTQACVKDIFDTLNSLDLSMVPTLTRHEKLVMRLSDRTDVFAEKFSRRSSREVTGELLSVAESSSGLTSKPNGSSEVVNQPLLRSKSATSLKYHKRTASEASGDQPSEVSHNSSGSVAMIGDESHLDNSHDPRIASNASLDALRSREELATTSSDSGHILKRRHHHRDTHFYETTIKYANIPLPIKVPVSAFTEEVGDFSLTELIKCFSSTPTTITGPLHPHLHTNGRETHPIILIFNAIITQKRVIFIGHGKPASAVGNCVLAACALASGSGCYLRGFVERAFPYINLSTKDVLEPFAATGYIAGVTNPIFEQLPVWDVLCNIISNTIAVHKDIATAAPALPLFPAPPTLNAASRTDGRSDGPTNREEEFGRSPTPSTGVNPSAKPDYMVRPDSYDALFMEEVQASIVNHVGEVGIRARFAEYVFRFLQLASRYEEDTLRLTYIGYPCTQYTYNSRTGQGALGSGIRFSDEVNGMRELTANASRIEGWRKSTSYEYWVQDFHNEQENSPIQGFDLEHQIVRLRNGKNIPEGEVALIFETMCKSIRTYDQVVELLAHCPPQQGGLQPVATGLFHQQEYIREMTVNLMNVIRDYPIGFQFLQSLNQFFRYSYIRQVHERQLSWRENLQQEVSNGGASYGAPSNHSQVSLGAI